MVEVAMPAAAHAPEVAGPGALDGLRVLDLTGSSLQYCGKLFAQMGAEVLLVEPTAGSRIRREGPFLGGIPHAERSLPFACYNQGKRGMALDLDSADGQALLRQLAVEADLLIEAERPGAMAARGLDAASLAALNPRLVVTSITPFGQTGPYSQYTAEDIVALAMGGLLYLGGYPDAEPVAVYGEQAYLAGAQFAAVASMAAVLQAEAPGGAGQQIDVSLQECVTMTLENAVQFVDLEKSVRERKGSQQRQAGSGLFACADGMVYLMAGGVASSRFWHATVDWLNEAGAPEAETLREAVWGERAYLASDEGKRRFARVFLPFAATRTKAELYADGQCRRIPICPLNTMADLLVNRQLVHRGFFRETLHAYTGRQLLVPGAPFRLTATPWRMGRPAPRLGEHTSEVLSGLGHDEQTQAAWLRAGVIA